MTESTQNLTKARSLSSFGRLISVLAIGLVGTGLLAGCTAPDAATRPSSQPSAIAEAAVTIDMPDLGPSPAPDQLSDERTEQLRLKQQDIDWRPVAHMHPGAVRPEVAFAGYADKDTYLDTLHACYTASGLTLGMKVNEIGETVVNDAEVDSEAHYLARFTCRATVTLKPEPWNAAQIGYHYDYLTEFLAPCYAANGLPSVQAPSRADYVANWPNPGWVPDIGDVFATPAAAPIIAACPGPFD
jgi:hypothetical protein